MMCSARHAQDCSSISSSLLWLLVSVDCTESKRFQLVEIHRCWLFSDGCADIMMVIDSLSGVECSDWYQDNDWCSEVCRTVTDAQYNDWFTVWSTCSFGLYGYRG